MPRPSRLRYLPLAVLALELSACLPDFDEDLSRLTAPRLLAVRSIPAEAKPSAPTKLEALIAVPDGEPTPVVNFGVCLARKPLTQLGPINQDCLEPRAPETALVPLGSGDSVATTVPEDACRLFGPLQPPPEAGKPSGRPVDPDVTGGFYQPFVARLGDSVSVGSVRLDCDLSGVGRDDAVKYRQEYRPNENPLLAEVSREGGGALDEAVTAQVSAGSELSLDASWEPCPDVSTCGDGFCTANEDQSSCAEDCTTPHGCTGAEPYVWYDAERRAVSPRQEGIAVAWYTSRGHFEDEQTGLSETETLNLHQTRNTWLVGSEPGPATLWLVIRDTRGGQSWKSFHFEVTP